MYKKFVILFTFALLFFLIKENVYGSVKEFSDDFDSYPDNSFPTKWVASNEPGTCNANWIVDNGILKIVINQYSCGINLIPQSEEWSGMGKNYTFELETKFISGTDHNIVYWLSGNSGQELHFQTPGDFILSLPPGAITNYSKAKAYVFNQTYRISITLNKKSLIVKIDDEVVRDVTLAEELPAGKIALRAGAGSNPHSETLFDNVVVRSLDETPTPTPTPVNLNVPSLKQTSSPWGEQIYDYAKKWAKSTSISYWGCALTSGAMILNYYGINLLPNGNLLNPGTLNSWLNSQQDGYIGQGWVNWLAISRLSKIAKTVNGITSYDSLEYTRKNTSDINILKEDINNLNPDILEEPGHFIVAKGINGDTFNINDPYYNRDTLNDGYSNSFLSLGSFVPSSTDLSYIMVVTQPNVTISVIDESGNNSGYSFDQQAMINDINPSEANSPIKIFYLNKPTNQSYELDLSSPTNKLTEFTIYLYDQNGSVKLVEEKAVLGISLDKFEINFNKNKLSSSTVQRKISIDDLIEDIIQLKNLKLIHSQFALGLENFAGEIKKDITKINKKIALMKLKTLERIIKLSPNILLTKDAKLILQSDISYLLKTL